MTNAGYAGSSVFGQSWGRRRVCRRCSGRIPEISFCFLKENPCFLQNKNKTELLGMSAGLGGGHSVGEKLLGVKWIQTKTKSLIFPAKRSLRLVQEGTGTIRNTGTTRPPPPFVAFHVCSRVPCAADNVAKENSIKHSICMYISSVEVY